MLLTHEYFRLISEGDGAADGVDSANVHKDVMQAGLIRTVIRTMFAKTFWCIVDLRGQRYLVISDAIT